MTKYTPKYKWANPTTLKQVGNMWAFSLTEWRPEYQRSVAIFVGMGRTPEEAEEKARIEMNKQLDKLAQNAQKQFVFNQDIADKILEILKKQKKTISSLSEATGIKREVVESHVEFLAKKYIVRKYEQRMGKYFYTYYEHYRLHTIKRLDTLDSAIENKIRKALKGRLCANTIAKKTRLLPDVVLSYLTMMVLDGEVTYYDDSYISSTGELKIYPRFKIRTFGKPVAQHSLKKGIETRAKILKTIAELIDIGGSPTLAAIMARGKMKRRTVQKGLRVLIDSGVLYVARRAGCGKTHFYLFTRDKIKNRMVYDNGIK
jgi:DNA-binding transcriptional ArsR family regulator